MVVELWTGISDDNDVIIVYGICRSMEVCTIVERGSGSLVGVGTQLGGAVTSGDCDAVCWHW